MTGSVPSRSTQRCCAAQDQFEGGLVHGEGLFDEHALTGVEGGGHERGVAVVAGQPT